MRLSTLAVFVAGLFFGGAIDHAILAAMGRVTTPYGLSVGVVGNWGMAGLDAVLTAALLGAARRLNRW
jgi:hypothetical protein